MPSDASVMPNWQADRYSLMLVVLAHGAARRRACRPSASSSRRGRPGAHERELGGHEEAVDDDEHDDGDEQERGHARSRARRADYFGGGRRRASGSARPKVATRYADPVRGTRARRRSGRAVALVLPGGDDASGRRARAPGATGCRRAGPLSSTRTGGPPRRPLTRAARMSPGPCRWSCQATIGGRPARRRSRARTRRRARAPEPSAWTGRRAGPRDVDVVERAGGAAPTRPTWPSRCRRRAGRRRRSAARGVSSSASSESAVALTTRSAPQVAPPSADERA